MRGYSVSCWDWLKARRPCANHNSLGLKDSRLKPQPPHVNHYNQNSSYIWIALLSRVNAEYRQITKKSTEGFLVFRLIYCVIDARDRDANKEINVPGHGPRATLRGRHSRCTLRTMQQRFWSRMELRCRRKPTPTPAKRDVPRIPGLCLCRAHDQGH